MTIASTPLDTSSPSSDPMIRVDQVSRVYHQKGGDVYALNQVTLEIQPGEFTVLMGPSGSGKTTVAALLYRFYNPESGSITIDGKTETSKGRACRGSDGTWKIVS